MSSEGSAARPVCTVGGGGDGGGGGGGGGAGCGGASIGAGREPSSSMGHQERTVSAAARARAVSGARSESRAARHPQAPWAPRQEAAMQGYGAISALGTLSDIWWCSLARTLYIEHPAQ